MLKNMELIRVYPAGSLSSATSTPQGLIINNIRRLVTLAEHTSDHGKQTNSSTKANDTLIVLNNNKECVFTWNKG